MYTKLNVEIARRMFAFWHQYRVMNRINHNTERWRQVQKSCKWISTHFLDVWKHLESRCIVVCITYWFSGLTRSSSGGALGVLRGLSFVREWIMGYEMTHKHTMQEFTERYIDSEAVQHSQMDSYLARDFLLYFLISYTGNIQLHFATWQDSWRTITKPQISEEDVQSAEQT